MIERVPRTPTVTSSFGVSRREGHDSSSFYARFTPPEISSDDNVAPMWTPADPFVCGDSSDMRDIPDNSVALVVTSPPYFVGKEYEEALGEGHVPATYLDYLEMLYRVFKECKRVLEPGGRIAVNVANLGRKPYRSLSADVIGILQDRLRFLLRGEVIWQKGAGSSGSCAWGSFRQASNPVLRDITERVIIASKGRFDRAQSAKQRREARPGLPHESTISTDEFLSATLDIWDILPEIATRVGHPAPFPVELPERLIRLYTFRDDLVLDPFMGVGSTLVAAARTDRRYVGYDIDDKYVQMAKLRVEAEVARLAGGNAVHQDKAPGSLSLETYDLEVSESEILSASEGVDYQARATREGKVAQHIAVRVLADCGFIVEAENYRIRGLGLEVNVVARDQGGSKWYFDVSGAFTTPRAGLLRTDTLWKALGRAMVLKKNDKTHIILLTTNLPQPRSAGDTALRAVRWMSVFDAIEMLSESGQNRLKRYASGAYTKPLPGFWSPAELAMSNQDNGDR